MISFNGLESKKWSRSSDEVFFRGQWIPAKWHQKRGFGPTEVFTKCGLTIDTPLGYSTRQTDPAKSERCVRCGS